MASIENLRKQAKQIVRWHRQKHFPVAPIIRLYLPRFRASSDSEILESQLLLTEAQELVARRAGFESWSAILEGTPAMNEPKSTTETARLTGIEPQLFTTDLSASLAFYRRLGFETVFSYGEPPFYAQVRRDGAPINFRLLPAMPYEPKEDMLAATVLVDDVKALYLEFKAAEVEFHQDLKKEPWGSRTFMVKDPDGNLVLFAGSG